MSTPLQEVYDSFIAKTENEDFTYRQDLVFQYFKSANAYAYKTVPENLTYIVNTNNAVLYITSGALINGNITISVNTDNYIIAILNTDSLTVLATKIKNAISVKYTVINDYTNAYPILTLSKSGVDTIDLTYIDTGSTGIGLIISENYNGSYINLLGQDTIELIALFMKREYYRKIVARFEKMKKSLGTKDFEKLECFNEYKASLLGLKSISEEIEDFRQEFYSYKN